MTDLFGITDLLACRGLLYTKKCKLVRHKDDRFDLDELVRTGWIDSYQAIQKKPVFRHCSFIVSFLGDGGGRAKLLGVYRVIGERKSNRKDFPLNSPFYSLRNDGLYYYELQSLPEFGDLVDRVVIEWTSERSWHQLIRNRPIIEIYPTGRKLLPFTDYLDFTLSQFELRELINSPEAHRDWYASLSAVAGIYLILAETSGSQYVGSAYGLDGIWGRWSQYATNGHGGNKLLRNLIRDDPNYPERFRFSLLQVLPKSTKKNEVIRWETMYKCKLGTRASGLNSN